MTRTVENKVIPLTGVIALKDRVDFLSTLLFNTIITNTTVEDTYTTRVTAGGLPVVSNTPTTVHKITGASAASINLSTVANQTIISNGVTFIGSAINGTVQMTGSVTEENEYATATVTSGFYLPVGTYTLYAPHKSDKVGWHIRNAQSTSIAELNWNGTTTAVSFSVSAAGNYHLYVFIPRSAGTLDYTETPMLLRGDRTANLPAFEPYYAGLKNASFKGITSTGRNLLDESLFLPWAFSATSISEKQIAFTISEGTYTVSNIVEGVETLKNVLGIYLVDDRNKVILSCNAAGNSGINVSSTFTVTEEVAKNTKYLRIHLNPVDAEYNIEHFMMNRGDTALPYEDYIADTSFQLATAQSLKKWDYIDVDNQRIVTGTAEVTQETAFTDEQLATYPAGYILSADRKTIAYPLETPTTAALTVPKSYTAWRNGSETVDTGATDALPPTITQTYYEEVTA